MLRTTQISLKSPEEQQKLRVAGALAADVLDMIGDHIAAGTSTRVKFVMKFMSKLPESCARGGACPLNAH